MESIKLPNGVYTYNPLKTLGKVGGFGQVFEGNAADGTEVAVKRLHVSAQDARHRELRIAEEFRERKFSHVIPFIDSGEDPESGRYFLIMPRADKSLQIEIESIGKLSPEKAIHILLDITEGLREIDPLVHRDLKPDNILFHEGKWKVADFGIARFAEQATSANTLKSFLTPDYAAPEQWRLEHATHATDVYALGCIAFFLLSGNPPFTENFSESHQKSPIPTVSFSDTRIDAAINMMLRKLPETRPSLERIKTFLNDVLVAAPVSQSGFHILTEAAALVSRREQEAQAKAAADKFALKRRIEMKDAAFDILETNIEKLQKKIYLQAPNADFPEHTNLVFECRLGDSMLAVYHQRRDYLDKQAFERSGWDVICSSQISVVQAHPGCSWASSLWYAKSKDSSEYRWHEISYWDPLTSQFVPFACYSPKHADDAMSDTESAIQIAFGPFIIDDEMENDFHCRWMGLFAKAASNELPEIRSFPIKEWPI